MTHLHPRSGLTALDERRASADLLVDRDRLTDLLGRPVRATRLRFKPGLSTTAVLLPDVAATERGGAVPASTYPAGADAAGAGLAPGMPEWIQVSHPEHVAKVNKAIELAQQRGQRVRVRQVAGLTLVHGPLTTDPRLHKGLDELRHLVAEEQAGTSLTDQIETGALRVLRYNPQRRLVLSQRPGGPAGAAGRRHQVVRVTARRQHGTADLLADLAQRGIPVVTPTAPQAGQRPTRMSRWPWFGRGDLAGLSSSNATAHRAARAAGVVLARLHTGTEPAAGAAPIPDPSLKLRQQVADLAWLDRAAAQRMQVLAAQVCDRIAGGQWHIGPVHGDFSADQVLVGDEQSAETPGSEAASPSIRLIDFDRFGIGPSLADLGNFAAAELLDHCRTGALPEHPAQLPLTTALIEGYCAEMPEADPREADLRTWLARSLLGCITDPFRAAEPGWVEAIHRRLSQVEEVLS